MTDSTLLTEQYLIALENPEPCNYTRMPNIIDHLTYDYIDEKTGESKVKKISIYAKELYRILKTISGQSNICWMNTENLAELANMSKSSVSECKKELQMKFHQLDLNPLIEIIEKKKITRKGDEKINGTCFHQITIKNIWGFNRAFFILKKIQKEEAGSPRERADGQVRHANAPSQGAGSPGERININNKTSLFKKQDFTADAAPVCSSNKENAVVSCEKGTGKDTAMFNWLMKIGCDVMGAMAIIAKHTAEELHLASGYVRNQIEKNRQKGKPLQNIVGYLRNTLQNRYWENTSC